MEMVMVVMVVSDSPPTNFTGLHAVQGSVMKAR